jgi:CIC family chloride channel protein
VTKRASQLAGQTRLRGRARLLLNRLGLKEDYQLVLLSIVIGATTGVFAHLFFFLIEWARDFAYGHDGATGLYSGRVLMLVLLPTIGALVVGYITHYFAREAKGHGVPEVMDAMYRKGGEVRPRIAVAKSVASALTIGSGGSAGTEGPIVQIGAAIGSSVGQLLHLHRRHMNIVVACGVSAGIAAIFNAPIAGVLFALEIFLKDFSFRTFSPVVFSSVIACSLIHALRLEDTAIFEVRFLQETGYVFVWTELPYFLLLGLVCGIGAVLFIRLLYLAEDITDASPIAPAWRPAAGAMLLGLTGVLFVLLTDQASMPPFFGNGYPVIKSILSADLLSQSIAALILLFFLKLLATCLTLGSGGSGGVFAPSLMLGASLGGAFGLLLRSIGLLGAESHVSAFALVGMAAMVAGTTHAPLTAIVMTYEITREPKVILPVMFAAIVATTGAQWFLTSSIYTLKLRRRGVRVGSVVDLTILRRITVRDVDYRPAHFTRPDDPLEMLIDEAGEADTVDFVVLDAEGHYHGMVTGRDIHTALLAPEAVSLLLVDELTRAGVPTVSPNETLETVLDKFARSAVESLPVADPHDQHHIIGLITREAVMGRYHSELELQVG